MSFGGDLSVWDAGDGAVADAEVNYTFYYFAETSHPSLEDLVCMQLITADATLHFGVGSVPEERPAIRPPSALRGWADWERGKKIFEKIEVPPAPPLFASADHRRWAGARSAPE